jgi:hypothetical protein
MVLHLTFHLQQIFTFHAQLSWVLMRWFLVVRVFALDLIFADLFSVTETMDHRMEMPD